MLATQLGVTTAVVAEFEKRPREKVGPAMQIALRRAMDVVEADERRRRGAASAGEPLTGADLARLRGERELSQRKFAELLGVGHGMVAKAEVAASEPLGDRMREALRAMLASRGGSATG